MDGACVTILKAWFAESYIIADPVTASPEDSRSSPTPPPPLTVGGELNKLAANIAIGRNLAGVHWRSDATASLRLGEAIALSVLKDQRPTYNEEFDGFTLTPFDGETITVQAPPEREALEQVGRTKYPPCLGGTNRVAHP